MHTCPGFLIGLECSPSLPSRIEQYYEAILALWNQLYINMKSLVSWHYCMIDIEKIRAMTIAKVCPLGCLEGHLLLDLVPGPLRILCLTT